MAMVRIFQGLQRSSANCYQAYNAARLMSDRAGTGAGKGGGAGGSIRSAGGAFGEMEAAREEEYFRRLQAQQIKKLHDHLEEEVHQHQTEIARLEAEIKRHKMKIDNLKEDMDSNQNK